MDKAILHVFKLRVNSEKIAIARDVHRCNMVHGESKR